jgi:beta-N-acetylhexosaminidase
MKKSLGQLMLIGISGPRLTHHEKKFIVANNISGVTLFGPRNLVDPKQIHELCSEIQSLRHQMPDRAPLFIGIDMEGGRVHRLKAPFTFWPAVQNLGKIDNPTVSFNFANRMGLEMKAMGINLNYAPCVDVFTNPKNTVIGDRSIGSDPELVAKHGSALVRGYVKAGVLACAKHFPGHGNTLLDSHEDLPIEQNTLEQLEKVELVPFKRVFKSRVDMTMTSHILFPKIDPDWPVTLSEIFLQKILRTTARYRGLIITDDLDMKGLTKHFPQNLIPTRAVQAGADLLLYCNEPTSPLRAIESMLGAIAQGQLDGKYIESQHERILSFKKEKLKNPDPLPYSEAIKLVGTPENMALAAAILRGEVPQNLSLET